MSSNSPNGDRKPGMLTTGMRAFLVSDASEYSERAAEQTRIRLRRRIRNALIDWSVLLQTLDDEDLRRIFAPAPQTHEDQWTVINGVIDCLAVCRVGCAVAGLPFVPILEEAFRRAEMRQGRIVDDVHVDIAVDYTQPSDPHRGFHGVMPIIHPDAESHVANLAVEVEPMLDALADGGLLDPEEVLDEQVPFDQLHQWAEKRLDTRM